METRILNKKENYIVVFIVFIISFNFFKSLNHFVCVIINQNAHLNVKINVHINVHIIAPMNVHVNINKIVNLSYLNEYTNVH